jgi:hypothetical protein
VPALAATWRLLDRSPAFVCYLLALALVPFRWLSPLGSFYWHAQWTDILVGLTALLWLLERALARDITRVYRPWQVPLALYLVLASISAAVAVPGLGGSWKTVLLIAELAVLAVITADFASEAGRRRVIARVIVASALATVALGVIALVLFYMGAIPPDGGLVWGYGDLVHSDLYTRVRAGFASAPLLASFCIFASGVAASRDADLGSRLRVPTQVSLGLLCLATISRAFIGFLFAVVIRRSATMHGRRRVIVPIAATALCVGILVALTVGSLHLNPADPSSVSYAVPGSHNTRRENFTSSLTTLGDHPVFGVGPGALPGLNLTGALWRPHFTPLNVAATVGIPALLALSAMFWLLWRTRRRPTDIALWSALAGMALDGLVGDIDHYRHLWVLVGLLGCCPPEDRSKD